MPHGEFLMGVKRGCGSNLYVAIVRWDRKDEFMRIVKGRLGDAESIEGVMYSWEVEGRRVIYYPRDGRLLLEASDESELERLLSVLLP